IAALGNGWWSAAEVAHAVDLVEPGLGVTDAPPAGLVPPGVCSGGLAGPPPGGAEDAPAIIIFTAGTTGFPKAVVLPHRSVISNLHGLLAVSGRLPHQLERDKPGATMLQSGPLFHIGGLQSLLLALLTGNTIVF